MSHLKNLRMKNPKIFKRPTLIGKLLMPAIMFAQSISEEIRVPKKDQGISGATEIKFKATLHKPIESGPF